MTEQPPPEEETTRWVDLWGRPHDTLGAAVRSDLRTLARLLRPRAEEGRAMPEDLVPPSIGETYQTGDRIRGVHCTRCGSPCAAALSEDVVKHFPTSYCCEAPVCYGYVTIVAFVGRDTGRRYFACHRERAERALGEPAQAESSLA
jgi:hypothetical protein